MRVGIKIQLNHYKMKWLIIISSSTSKLQAVINKKLVMVCQKFHEVGDLNI